MRRGLRSFLADHPGLVCERALFEGTNYFRNPTLLQFVAENRIRCGKLPKNIVELAQVILDVGAREARNELDETLGLVCSGRISREFGAQIPLIGLLYGAGANPDAALEPALAHGEFEAVEELVRRGARMSLPVAAATRRSDDARRTLGGSDAGERHRALALAAQFGHVEILRLLLDAGEEPSRYNPVGFHSHSTPLHQAALAGHFEAVRLLVERGARLELRDMRYQGTPAGWASHAGHRDIEGWLNDRE
jgi:peptide-methionine (S)-S-oxide reductase